MEAPASDRPLLLHGRRRLPLSAEGLTIGRDPANDVALDDPAASRRHAILRLTEQGVELEDCGSTNGTAVNGEVLRGERRLLETGDVVTVGAEELRVVAGRGTELLETPHAAEAGAWALPLADEAVTIGRDPANEAMLDDPNVSRFHVEVRRDGDGFLVRDLGSRNGTWIEGRQVDEARVAAGQALRVGRFRIVLEPEGLMPAEAAERSLEAAEVSVERGGRLIVAPTSLAVRTGELLAIIGRSGCGKTTLVKALAGVIDPDAGTVSLDGEPLECRLPEIGYLPQDEVVHPQLTPREALRYAARLRLPSDAARPEIDRLVEATLAELDLSHRADTRIGRLSGGERRRAGLAAELLARPAVLFLDEPTTGLDPGLERQTMELLARLAADGRAVVVVTHATASLELCDRVAVLGPDGRLRFLGRPADALAHFGVDAFAGIYAAVEAAPEATAPAAVSPLPQVARGRRKPRRSGHLTQVRVLVARYLKTFTRDRRNAAILLLQVPLLGIALGALFGADVFSRSRRGNPNDAAQVLFLLSTVAIWIGAVAAAREIVKERAVIARERAIGVRTSTYLASKCLVLFGLVVLLCVALTGVVVALRPLHASSEAYLAVFALVAATGVVAAGLGLALSAAARSEEQATSFIPLALVPQLLFAGALVPVSKMGEVMEAVASAMPSRWSFASLGTAVDMAGRLRADPYDARYSPFRRSFFDVSAGEGLLVLAGFLIVVLAAAAWFLARRNGPAAGR